MNNAATKTLDLRGLGESERSVRVNVTVALIAGLTPSPINPGLFRTWESGESYNDEQPPSYATALDATTPLLANRDWQSWTQRSGPNDPIRYYFAIYPAQKEKGYEPSCADTEALARCYAILRAHGYTILT